MAGPGAPDTWLRSPDPIPSSRHDAVRLFIERAQAAKPDFTVSDRNVYAIAEICHRLDGLPLGIELAAARVNVFSPPALLARLENRLAVLTGGPRDLPLRQQTLRQAIAWSYDLLSPGEQMLYRGLSVFVGGCTLAAAEAVVAASGADPGLEVVDGMASLVDKSLLRQEDRASDLRFRMLETIREHALERLGVAGETERFGRAHAQHYLALVEQGWRPGVGGRAEPGLLGGRLAGWLDRLDEEHDNLRAARLVRDGPADEGLRLAAALRRFWRARGYLADGREWMTAMLALPAAQLRTSARATTLHAAGMFASQQGDYGEARARFEESLEIYRELGDTCGIGQALVDVGILTRYEGNHLTARSLLEEGLGLVRETGDLFGSVGARQPRTHRARPR